MKTFEDAKTLDELRELGFRFTLGPEATKENEAEIVEEVKSSIRRLLNGDYEEIAVIE